MVYTANMSRFSRPRNRPRQLTMTLVALSPYSRSFQCLIFRQTRQHSENHGRPTVQLNLHESMGDGIGYIFKMHS